MMHRPKKWTPVLLVAGWIVVSSDVLLAAEDAATAGRAVNIRTSGGMRIVAVKRPPASSAQTPRTLASPSMVVTAGEPVVAGTLSTPYPRPPLAGFSPLVAITTSDKHQLGDDDFEHVLESGYQGSALNPPASENFVVGIFDSGSGIDMLFEPFNVTTGLVGSYVTSTGVEIGGIGGTALAYITQPVGLFMAPLSAVDPATGLLELAQVVGHSNNSMLVAPEINCGEAGGLTAIVSTSLLSFYNTIIRVDAPVHRTVGGDVLLSPDLEILSTSTSLPTYPRKIAMTFGGMAPVTTSAFFGFDVGTGMEIWAPTMLAAFAGTIPTGGGFFATIGAIEGEPGPTNPLQDMRVLVDTGSQTSIITPAMAANLNLDLNNPDFTVDACGVGGLVTGIPGFYVDYIKMNASGGALEFSQAPFVVVDLTSPDGGSMDGVLGMNFFWNRNIIFQPSLSSSGFLHVSDVIPFAYGDFDRDLDVDQDDFAVFTACSTGPGILVGAECTHVDADEDGDLDQADFGFFQACLSGENVPANVNCKP